MRGGNALSPGSARYFPDNNLKFIKLLEDYNET